MKTALFLITLILVPVFIFAAEQPVWVNASGEAEGSDLEAPREVCERAKAEAQRSALELAVGTFVRSHTIVSNSQLAEDLIYARVRGRIERMEVQKQERSPAANGCRVWIKALVKPVLPAAQDCIQIKAALTRTELREGDEIGIQYQVDRKSFVYLFVIAADNSVTQLLPNSEKRENSAVAKQHYQFPPIGSGTHLKAALLPESKKSGAVERIKIIATKQSEPLLEKGFQEGFAVYDAQSTGLMSDLLKRLNQLDPADWGEATLEYKILP
jgi:hypothetical protein